MSGFEGLGYSWMVSLPLCVLYVVANCVMLFFSRGIGIWFAFASNFYAAVLSFPAALFFAMTIARNQPFLVSFVLFGAVYTAAQLVYLMTRAKLEIRFIIAPIFFINALAWLLVWGVAVYFLTGTNWYGVLKYFYLTYYR